MNRVGYLVNHKRGIEGERGIFYDYILASNGLFIEARGKMIAARVPVADAEVRGLAHLEPKVELCYGRIPQRFFDLAVSAMMVDTSRERYMGVAWDYGYQLYVPEQETTGASVQYSVGSDVVLDLHSHGNMGAFFSGTDNQDEQGLRLYAVVGKLNETPVVKLRAGVYGYFYPLRWNDVFEGNLTDIVEFEKEEVTAESELPSLDAPDPGHIGHRSGWLWWHRWLRR